MRVKDLSNGNVLELSVAGIFIAIGHTPNTEVFTSQLEMDDDGYVSLPTGPGLGVEVDEARVIELATKPPQQFEWPHSRLTDGSVADY